MTKASVILNDLCAWTHSSDFTHDVLETGGAQYVQSEWRSKASSVALLCHRNEFTRPG